MTTNGSHKNTVFEPMGYNAELWLKLLQGATSHRNGNGHYHVNGVNGTETFAWGSVEPFPNYWLRLLSNTRYTNGVHGQGSVSVNLPIADLKSEKWLKILEGK